MDYYQKYQKYRSKYLILKSQRNGLIGGAGEKVVINLDQYKELFQRCIHEIPYEMGFNLLLDNGAINFEITKGRNDTVTIPHNIIINIHSHPISLEQYRTWKYHPPTHTDYCGSSTSSFHGIQLNIVVEKAGVWLFQPTKKLIAEIEEIQPNAGEIFSKPIQEGQSGIYIDIGEEMNNLNEAIYINSSNHGVYLNFTGDNVKQILSEAYISGHIGERIEQTRDDREESIQRYEMEAKRELSKLSIEELRKIIPHYHKIELDEYIHNMKNILSDGVEGDGMITNGMGFDVKFIKWDEPINIEIELNERTMKVFAEIKSRNLMINNFDIIKANIDKTRDNHIIRQ